MSENLLYYIPSLIYMAWAASYFFARILAPRKSIRHPRLSIFTLCLIMIFGSVSFRKIVYNLGTTFVQLSILLMVLFLFQDKLRLRLISYIVFMMLLIIVELNASTLFLFIKQSLSRSPYASTAVREVNGIPDLILSSLLVISMGILLFCKTTPLLKHLLLSIKSRTIFQLILPLYLPFIMQLFIYQRSYHFGLGAALYFFAFLMCCPVFLTGVKNIRNQEKKRIMKEKNILLAKAQLESSKKMEQEYRKLRKWNHDIENHLLSLSYLMDMKKYEEAAAYYTDFTINPSIPHSSDKTEPQQE